MSGIIKSRGRGTRAKIRMSLTVTAAMGIAAGSTVRAIAATNYVWDANGSASGTGGAGAWNTTTSLWTTDGTTFTTWPTTGTTNIANFGGTGGAVSIGGAVTADGMTFTSAGYSITGSGPLTLNGAAPTFNTGGFNVTFGLAANELFLSGSSTIFKTGVGILTLVNDQRSSLTGATTWNISGGTVDPTTGLYNSELAISTGQPLGNSTGNVTTLDGATLAFTANGGAGFATPRIINITANGGAIYDGGFAPGLPASGGATLAPTINIAAGPGLNLVAANVLDIDAGSFSGAGSVNVMGSGTTKILSTNNTFTGGTTVAAGSTLVIGGAKSLGQGTGNLTDSGTINLNNATLAVGKFTSNGGAVDFNVSTGGVVNQLTATSAVVSGTTRIVLGLPSVNAVSGSNTYTLATSSSGGLTGSYVGSFLLPGGQNLSVPMNAVIHTVNGVQYRMTATATANTNGTAVTFTTTDAPAPSHTISIMPLGSSITEGDSAQVPYDGGGYRSQLYQNLVNDGRFNPNFVGSNAGTGANNPLGADLMTSVGQGHNEGHSGYTTSGILQYLSPTWLASGNGVNPDLVTLNIGGNDYVANPNDTTAVGRLDTIINQVESLRPGATVIVSTVMYRGDGGGAAGSGIENLYDPFIPGLVYQHVLAGQHVSFVDMNNIITPGNSLKLIGPDLIHPTQAGYNIMANAWYASVTTGQAFFTGAAGSTWNSVSGPTTSFDMDYQRTTDSGVVPSAGTDVYFNGIGGATTLGANFSVRSVNFTAAATAPVAIGGGNILTIGSGGITVQAGTGAHTISSAVNLGSAQTWANAATSRFTVSGSVGGSGPLDVGLSASSTLPGGSGLIVLSGNNAYTGGTALAAGTLVAANTTGSATGSGPVNVAAGATLTGTGNIAGIVNVSGIITAGLADGSFGTLTTGAQTWNSLGKFASAVAPDGITDDQLVMSGLAISATTAEKFLVVLTGAGTTAINPLKPLVLATDLDLTPSDPFFPSTYLSTTQSELSLSMIGVQPAAGYTLQFTTVPSFNVSSVQTGYSLAVVSVPIAVPEPAGLAVFAVGATTMFRRRRQNQT